MCWWETSTTSASRASAAGSMGACQRRNSSGVRKGSQKTRTPLRGSCSRKPACPSHQSSSIVALQRRGSQRGANVAGVGALVVGHQAEVVLGGALDSRTEVAALVEGGIIERLEHPKHFGE